MRNVAVLRKAKKSNTTSFPELRIINDNRKIACHFVDLKNLHMRFSTIARSIFCAALLMQSIVSFAFETDQYNLPPKPLADIGEEVSHYTEQNLRKAVNKINAEISATQSCLENNFRRLEKIKCNSLDRERLKLEFLRSEQAVARAVYKQLGAGITPFTNSEIWMNTHHFIGQPARYKTDYEKSIFAVKPFNYLTISPTVNLYGAQFGTDKIAHFFQQGYTYYQKYNRAIADGLTHDKAVGKAIRWGQMTERTFYGTLVSGVYSNGDLCANYVGMKFYQGLTRKIKIGDSIRPAVLLLKNGFWTFSENAELQEILIKPFISKHFNEVLNPSNFSKNFGLHSFVRRSVRKRSCKAWLNQNPNLTKADLNASSQNLKRWHGEDYGFTDSEKFVTIANTCFD